MEKIRRLCHDSNVVLVEDCAHAFYLEASTSLLGSYGDFSFFSLHKYIATETGGILKINNTQLSIPDIQKNDRPSYEVIEQYALTDFEAVKNIRRKNYSQYANALKAIEQIHILYELSDNDIPQSFPIGVHNSKREALYFYLMDRSIPTTALYYRMIEEIDSNNYPLSFEISNEILNLPVHQDTNAGDIAIICAAIVDFFEIQGE